MLLTRNRNVRFGCWLCTRPQPETGLFASCDRTCNFFVRLSNKSEVSILNSHEQPTDIDRNMGMRGISVPELHTQEHNANCAFYKQEK
jgi:hypothetical protein